MLAEKIEEIALRPPGDALALDETLAEAVSQIWRDPAVQVGLLSASQKAQS